MEDRRFLSAFTDAVKQGPLRTEINMQQVSFIASQLLEQTAEGAPVDLGPLYAAFLEAGHNKEFVQQTFMSVIQRADGLAVLIREPSEISALNEQTRARVLRRYEKQRPAAATYQKPVEDTSAREVAAHNPNKRPGEKKGPSRGLIYATIASAVICIAGYTVIFATEPEGLKPVVTTNARGLHCATLEGNAPVLLCKMKPADFEKVDPDVLEARAKQTFKELKIYTRVHILHATTGKTLRTIVRRP